MRRYFSSLKVKTIEDYQQSLCDNPDQSISTYTHCSLFHNQKGGSLTELRALNLIEDLANCLTHVLEHGEGLLSPRLDLNPP